MKIIPDKTTGDTYTADEFTNGIKDELQEFVKASGQTLEAIPPYTDTQMQNAVNRFSSRSMSHTATYSSSTFDEYTLTFTGYGAAPTQMLGGEILTFIVPERNTKEVRISIPVAGITDKPVAIKRHPQLVSGKTDRLAGQINDFSPGSVVTLLYAVSAFIMISDSVNWNEVTDKITRNTYMDSNGSSLNTLILRSYDAFDPYPTYKPEDWRGPYGPYQIGEFYICRMPFTNTGNITVNINDRGTVALKTSQDQEIPAGALLEGEDILIRYPGGPANTFEVLNLKGSPGLGGQQTFDVMHPVGSVWFSTAVTPTPPYDGIAGISWTQIADVSPGINTFERTT